MMQPDRSQPGDEGIPTRDARARFSELLGRAEYAKERIRLTRHGKTVAYIVPSEDVEELEVREALEREQLLADIREGFAQIERGEGISKEEARQWLRERQQFYIQEMEKRLKSQDA